jgi:hypothetical protein
VTDFVVVYRTIDPIAGEMLTDILVQHGIAARLIGTRNAAAIGVAPAVLDKRIEVPASQAVEALDVLRSFTDFSDGDSDDDGGGDAAEVGATGGAASDDGSGPPRLSALLAAGSCIAIFGGSHFYARRPWTGLVIACAQLVAIGLLLRAHDWPTTCAGLMMFFGLLAVDVAGGQLAVRAHNRHRTARPVRQLAGGVMGVASLAAVAFTAAPHVPEPRDRSDVAHEDSIYEGGRDTHRFSDRPRLLHEVVPLIPSAR